MVLLWVYRAAEIKKNLLAKITADSLPHQVGALLRLHSALFAMVPAIHRPSQPLSPHNLFPLTPACAGRPSAQRAVQHAAHVVRAQSFADALSRRRALFVRF